MTAGTIQTLDDPKVYEALVALLEQQRSLFAQLHELSEHQSKLVEQSQADELLQLLSQRQAIIDELVTSNQRLEPYRRDWQRLFTELDEPRRRRVAHLLQEVQQSLSAILAQDERDREALQSQQRGIGSELSGMARAGSAAQAYRNVPRSVDPRFTDRKG